jgi:hypothetical protein
MGISIIILDQLCKCTNFLIYKHSHFVREDDLGKPYKKKATLQTLGERGMVGPRWRGLSK